MAEVPLSGLGPYFGALAPADLLVMVDVSDTTQAPTGSTKKTTVGDLFTSPTFTGTVTVSTALTVLGPAGFAGAVQVGGSLTVASGQSFLVTTIQGNFAPNLDLYLQPGGPSGRVVFRSNAAVELVEIANSGVATFHGRLNAYTNESGNNSFVTANTSPTGYGASISGGAGAAYSLNVLLYSGAPLFTVAQNGSALSSALTVNGPIDYTGTMVQRSGGGVLSSTASTTGYAYIVLANTAGNVNLAVESSVPGAFAVGTSANAALLGTNVAKSLQLFTNNTVRLTIDAAGLSTFGGPILPGPLVAFGPGIMGTYGPYGLYLQAKTGSTTDFAVGTPGASGLIISVPTGTSDVQFAARVTVGGAFGCNAKPPSSALGLGGAASDLATVIALANALRTVALTFGFGF